MKELFDDYNGKDCPKKYTALVGHRQEGTNNIAFDWPEGYPTYKPLYVTQLSMEIAGGIDKMPWPMKVIQIHPHRCVGLLIRTDQGLLSLPYEFREWAERQSNLTIRNVRRVLERCRLSGHAAFWKSSAYRNWEMGRTIKRLNAMYQAGRK